MPSPRVANLTKEDILSAAKGFLWNRQMPKWSVIVEGRELPARPLILEAAKVPPNDSTNSHQAVAILKGKGFEVRYNGETIDEDGTEGTVAVAFEHLITKLRGSCKGGESLVEAREREHRNEKY
jgi:hypothetical protein